ncbi:MAG: hypothetical protein RL204_2212, partial [Bacteroidota bacterium]
MTEQEALKLSGQGPFWISFYYNRIDHGTLVRNPEIKEWFFIPTSSGHKNNIGLNWKTELPQYFEAVDLAMINEVSGPAEVMENYNSAVTTSDYNETILVVLGAGASYDYNDISKEGSFYLPLTKDVFSSEFNSILSRYEGAQSLYNSIVDIEDLEAFFQRKWNLLARSYNPKLMRELVSCQFYLQELFFQLSILSSRTSPNYYAALVHQMRDYGALKRNRVKFLVVNFNYDTLFEQQVEKELGYKFDSIEMYDDPNRLIQVFKLHGSCNWCRYDGTSKSSSDWEWSSQNVNGRFSDLQNLFEFTQLLEPKISIMNDSKNKVSENLDHHYDKNKLLQKVSYKNIPFDLNSLNLVTRREYFPHMLIPYRDKDEFLVPSSQLSRLELMLEKCSRIYCIGWKG